MNQSIIPISFPRQRAWHHGQFGRELPLLFFDFKLLEDERLRQNKRRRNAAG
jgi:hypothetical protein